MALLRERLERIAERQRQLGLAPPDGDDTLTAAILVETEP
jgi:DNA-binding ferritin-like protein